MVASELPRDTLPAPSPQDYASAVLSELHISVWTGDALDDSVCSLSDEIRCLAAARGTVSILLVVESTASGRTTPESRRIALRMLRDLGPRVHSVAVAVEGRGMWAATIREVFVALAVALKPKFQWRIFTTTGSAITWLIPHLSRSPANDARAIETRVDALRG